MIQNPIHRVLSTLHTHDVRYLLMGGQACVLYGGAEFSRDTDIVILPREDNLTALDGALAELKAELIAVPPSSLEYLRRGHAIHYRCRDEQAAGIRLDVMSVMRGVEPFEILWDRRTTVELNPDLVVDVISLPDLVRAKKTQRDKDWPMIRRLIEADFEEFGETPSEAQVRFWILEARTPAILRELHSSHHTTMNKLASQRPVLALVPDATDDEILSALHEEEQGERAADREYWTPLKKELEEMRRNRR